LNDPKEELKVFCNFNSYGFFWVIQKTTFTTFLLFSTLSERSFWMNPTISKEWQTEK